MYLARETFNKRTHYYIRESYRDGAYLKSRNVFDLGIDPSQYIVYPGGHGYYYDPAIEETLEDFGIIPKQDELDHIFWEFLDPEIRHVITGFQRNFHDRKPNMSEELHHAYHHFDKRRIHFLRFGRMDQRGIDQAPDKLFALLNGKSRDEIEQYFLVEERILAPREYKKYIHTIFSLSRFFEHAAHGASTEKLNQEKMDAYFVERLCSLNADAAFWSGMPIVGGKLQIYLIRYAVMYFDYELPLQATLQDTINAFRNRHRDYRPPRRVRMNMAEAARLFETTWEVLKKMDVKAFMRLYRKQAKKHHPDQGGDQESFVKLTQLYEGILRKKRGG